MTRVAPQVHVDPARIDRLEQLALQLPQDGQVQVLLDDGRELRGIVSATPSMQVFFDSQGREGLNAVLQIEAFLDDGRPHQGGVHRIWLDEVRTVTRVPNPSPPEPSSRYAPADPNAPTPE
jgi:hypothetical protein